MYILAIETTGPVGSVAAVQVAERGRAAGSATAVQAGDKVQAAGAGTESAAVSGGRIPMEVTTRTMSHLKNLIPMTEKLLDEEGIDKKDIAAVAASAGPGSFTGIRIGVSTARALSQAWDVPCISVPSLEQFKPEYMARAGYYTGDDPVSADSSVSGDSPISSESPVSGNSPVSGDAPVCVIFNARRGQVYGACFGADGTALIEPGPYMLSDMLSRIETLRIAPVFYGDGVDAYFDKEEFSERVSGYKTAPQDQRYQTAVLTAAYAEKLWSDGEKPGSDGGDRRADGGKILGYGELLPDYMRESEAEQRLKDGSLEKMRKAKLERLMKMAGK